ncbi:MAG TPA: hypothetical protein VL860_10480 [Planctomycetota bacterium]|nr:hypothetical protein [Planctomycetota bacterium]
MMQLLVTPCVVDSNRRFVTTGRCAALRPLLALVLFAAVLALPALRAEQIPEIESNLTDQSSRFKVGTLAVFVYGSAGLGFDDNVFLAPTSRQAALFAFLVPGIRAKRPEDNHGVTLQFDYQGRARRYAGEGNVAHASYMEHQFAIQAVWKISARQTWNFSENAAYLVDPISASIPRTERFENGLNLGTVYTGRTTDIDFSSAFSLMRFSRAAFRDLDFDNLNLDLKATYHDLGPKAHIVGEYGFNYYNLRDHQRSDFTVHSLLAGIATPVGENKGWVYELRVGAALAQVVANRAANRGDDQLTTFAVTASATWSKSDPNTFMKFSVRNSLEPSNNIGATFANTYTVDARGQIAFNRFLRAGGGASMQWVEDIGTSRDVARLNLSGSLSYHVTETFFYFGRIEYRQRFAHFRRDRYDDFRLLGGATYVF